MSSEPDKESGKRNDCCTRMDVSRTHANQLRIRSSRRLGAKQEVLELPWIRCRLKIFSSPKDGVPQTISYFSHDQLPLPWCSSST
jgi:hypothetical protein